MMVLLDFAEARVNRRGGKKNHGNHSNNNTDRASRSVIIIIIIIIIIITSQLQSLVTVRELTSIETRQKVGLAIGWIDIQCFARPVI